jgi:hypothetical protein
VTSQPVDLLGRGDAPGREDMLGGDAPGREDMLGGDAPGREDMLSNPTRPDPGR